MPITATPCGPTRWRDGWKSWMYSGPSPGQESQTTSPTRNSCSVQRSTGRTVPAGHSPARRPPASGWRHLRTGTTNSTATAGSSSCHPTSVTTGMMWGFAVTGLSSMNSHAKGIYAAGHDQSGAGVSPRWCGSTRRRQKSNSIQLRCRWLPELQQRHHLSWQSPARRSDP
jgi:hypothetical protein